MLWPPWPLGNELLIKIHTPPEEDCGKKVSQRGCEFSNAPTICVVYKSTKEAYLLEIYTPPVGDVF